MPISKQDLIIDARHVLTRRRRLVSWLLTLLGWCAWFYLWLPAFDLLRSWLIGHAVLSIDPGLSRLAQSLTVLEIYLLVAALLGGALILWSRVNYWRFAGVERRSTIADAPLEELAGAAALPVSLLQRGCQAQILVVHHQKDGEISGIDVLSPLAGQKISRTPQSSVPA